VKEFHRTAYNVLREAIQGYEEQRARELSRLASGGMEPPGR
jgi:hypothetical protein